MNRPLRFIIATPICDGHDVAAAAITRILRLEGAQAVYIGFNKTPYQIAKAASEEDATAIAISTYNGGHVAFLKELVQELKRQGINDIPIFVGGGGTILEKEIEPLKKIGITKVYRPPLDLTDAIRDMISIASTHSYKEPSPNGSPSRILAQTLTLIEAEELSTTYPKNASIPPVVWGIGGRGGAGKSTLIDELILRFLISTEGSIAILTADPTLGDRLRMIHCYNPRVFMRSVSVRPGESTSGKLAPLITKIRENGYQLILVESVGLGQNELGVAPIVDSSIFCMTPEYGTDIQLEKEALLSSSEIVVMNKRDYPQSEARARRVQQFITSGQKFFLTEAKHFGDPGVNELFTEIAQRSELGSNPIELPASQFVEQIPFNRRSYLGSIVDTHRKYYEDYENLGQSELDGIQAQFDQIWDKYGFNGDLSGCRIENGIAYREVDNGEIPVARKTTTGIWVPVIGIPHKNSSLNEIVRYVSRQNVPGSFPYTEGAYQFRRKDEDPIRMFAGLGLPETTNQRFHLLAKGHGSPRLSTAFDSLTLYGLDSDEPGAAAKVGEGGVAVDTIDDMLRLYDGFDLESTSVSLTMNGPAPTIMAMYLAAAKRRGFDWSKLRGTIQTDIFKELQAQNEAQFPLEPSLRLIGDMVEFMMPNVPSWYPISISGYHIGEAGANPIQELAFTLANGLTYIEVFKSRGLSVEEFTKKFSFFFTSGSELEFNVLGRVARRIWAVALKKYYGVEGNGAALKFHSQTSGRSLQDTEPLHNLTRVALQAEHALHNNTNSLHTNSYKETYTTPEEDDALLAMGSQQIPLVESGDFGYIENLNQGSYGLSYLEDAVESAVHQIFTEINMQGGVIPAIENEYFRTAIQEEVQRERKAMREGERKIIGVNYLSNSSSLRPRGQLVNIPMKQKRHQIKRTKNFKADNQTNAAVSLRNLQKVAMSDGNVFESLLDAVEYATVGQITNALSEVWGKFRPSM